MSLDNQVLDFNISLGSPGVSRQGFGTPLILALAGGETFAERLRYYSNVEEAQNDAELSADSLARVTTMFSQDIAADRVAVGRREADVAQVTTFTVTGAADGDYTITINGLAHTFTATTSTVTLIVAGLVSAINTGVDLGGLTLTFTDNGTSPDTITRSTGSWITDGVAEGMDVTITGSTSNNSTFTVESVTATVLTLAPSETLTDEGPVAVTTCVVQVPVTATDNDPDVTVTADVAGTPFTYSSASTGDAITEAATTANTSVATELVAIAAENNDWYGIVSATRSDTDILRIAKDYCEAAQKMFFAQSSSADLITAANTDIASDLQRRSLNRTAVMYYSDNTENADCAWASSFFSSDFDQQAPTAAFLTLQTIPSEELGSTAETNLNNKNASYYTTFKGIGATANASVASGFDIELVVTRDWLEARGSEAVAQLFLDVSNSGDRIQYNDLGFQQVGGVFFSVVKSGERIGHFNPETSQIDIPARADVAAADVSAGILRIEFGTQYSGRVKQVVITGIVAADFETLNP